MKKVLIPFLVTATLTTGCMKDEEEIAVVPGMATPAAIPANASYKMILTGRWMSPEHTVPASDHFTNFVGVVHGKNAFLFHTGAIATPGIKRIAETGNDVDINPEIDNMIAGGAAASKFAMNLTTITSTDELIVNLSVNHSRVSIVSMIAPSPDWFVGLDGQDMIQNGKWADDITVHLYGYDAGTEEGDVFGYNNAATAPQQPIALLSPSNASVIANGNPSVARFATIRFIRQ